MSRRGAGLVWISMMLAGCESILDLEHVDYRAPEPAADADADPDADASPDGADERVRDDAAVDVVDAPRKSTGDPTCDVRNDDRKLYCTNRADAPLRSAPNTTAPIVNTLRTTSSFFECWGIGEQHAGGNSTWYFTLGDDTPTKGWLPGVMLNTPDDFDANPSAYGLPKCP